MPFPNRPFVPIRSLHRCGRAPVLLGPLQVRLFPADIPHSRKLDGDVGNAMPHSYARHGTQLNFPGQLQTGATRTRGNSSPTPFSAMVSIAPTLQRVCLGRVLGHERGTPLVPHGIIPFLHDHLHRQNDDVVQRSNSICKINSFVLHT